MSLKPLHRGAADLIPADFQKSTFCSRRTSMGSDGIYSHIRNLPLICRSTIRHLRPQARVHARLCRCRRLQYSVWSQCTPHHASHFPCYAGNRYVIPGVDRYFFSLILFDERSCNDISLGIGDDNAALSRSKRARPRSRYLWCLWGCRKCLWLHSSKHPLVLHNWGHITKFSCMIGWCSCRSRQLALECVYFVFSRCTVLTRIVFL